jgi:hypothetical protein
MELSKKYLELEIDKCKLTISNLEQGLWLHNAMLKVFENELSKLE